ncbi:PREDICTED: 28 kDa ribonucleoprotein, chloroplastic [Tarenaya hassleriana]|uniref:28 kDa ribonucleoprotein, chloroplastic n=1 Tax=Tarenaya hassleriana TaxID=28532 RepID=UPI00053C978B|nr:PREDICTED: 28 kDa ribonucleoprotein, chloroplastic [Tarenaya hassleriana]
MALLRLPGVSLHFSRCQSDQKCSNPKFSLSSVSLSSSSCYLSRIQRYQTIPDAVSAKPKPSSSFTLYFSATTQDQVLESSSSSSSSSSANDAKPLDEFSKSRLIAQNVPWTSTPEDIRSLFEKYGNVVDIEVSMHNKSRNRGLAFIEMGSPEEAASALRNLESYQYEGRVLKINYAKRKTEKPAPPAKPNPVPTFNLFVANLSFEARAKNLKEFFDSGSGNVVSAEIIFHDNPRRSSGYGFVSFKTKKQAEAALNDFQGKEFMGRPIRVARSKQFVKLQAKEGLEADEEPSQSNTNEADEEASTGET